MATAHVAPAARVRALMAAPAAAQLAEVLGADAGALTDVLADPAADMALRILGSRFVATAYVPALGARAQGAFVFGAWVGGYSQLLRWGLLDHHLGTLRVHKFDGMRRVWTRNCNDIRRGYHLSLTVHEGVLVGCFSEESLGVLYLLPRVASNFPVAPVADAWSFADSADEFRLAPVRSTPDSQTIAVWGGLREVTGSRIAAEVSVEVPTAMAVSDVSLPKGEWGQDLAGILGDAPGLLALSTVNQVELLAKLCPSSSRVPIGWQRLRGLLSRDGMLGVFACGDDFYGRIMRMKVPAIGLAVPLAADEDDVAIPRIVDTLNALWGWGVVAVPDSRDPRIRVIDSVREGVFKKLGGDERPALVVRDNWLIAVSSVDVLRRMLAADDKGSVDTAWGSRCHDYEAAIYAWSDMQETGDLFTKALAGYTLLSLMQSGSAPNRRYDTALVKSLIQAAGTLGTSSLWVRRDGIGVMLRVELEL
jgi:hypothetical protein